VASSRQQHHHVGGIIVPASAGQHRREIKPALTSANGTSNPTMNNTPGDGGDGAETSSNQASLARQVPTGQK
jgi:hypothetical protein